MIRIPSATARQCIKCLDSIGSLKERRGNPRLKIKKNINAQTQWELYKNHNILVKQHSHYSCHNCHENISTITKHTNITNENIKQSKYLNYIIDAFGQIINEKEKIKDKTYENQGGITMNNLNEEQLKSMTGLQKEQIENIANETGMQTNFGFYVCF